MKSLKLFVAFLFALVIMVFGSCIPTEDDDLNPADKFIGTWSVSDQATRLNYQVNISTNLLHSSEIRLSNFADLGNTAIGLVVGNTIVLENQAMGGNYSVSGSGSYVNDVKLTFNYQLNDGIELESRSAVFSK